MSDRDTYVDHDAAGDRRVIIRRSGFDHIELSRLAEGGEVIHGIGLDHRAYLAAQDFTHPFVPYAKYPESCDTCGWAEAIHGERRTHIECDWCGEPSPINMTNRVRMYERHTPSVVTMPDDAGELAGKTLTIKNELCLTRFFCWTDCLQLWLAALSDTP